MDIVWSILFDINKELKKCITVWTRKRKYYLDMKITNVILNELDIYKNSCFVFLRLLCLWRTWSINTCILASS
ncbi:unnamed protein product [Rhizophagus irregularis]|nr:unnamed protein product [Rhizophagus irregularis]CAB4392577.1 unnamed protein product [Rhizophagus irregularis]CAB4440692.1 unnamed protein product [Rhizophagus irregularis]